MNKNPNEKPTCSVCHEPFKEYEAVVSCLCGKHQGPHHVGCEEKTKVTDEWWEEYETQHGYDQEPMYEPKDIPLILKEERRRVLEAIEGIEMPKWNACYDEVCKDRSCRSCKEYAETASLDKAHILSRLSSLEQDLTKEA